MYRAGVLVAVAVYCLALPACQFRGEPKATALVRSSGFSRSAEPTEAVAFGSPRNGVPSESAAEPLTPPENRWAEIEARVRRDIALSLEDYGHFYSPENLAWAGLGIGLAAPLAHTPADRSIRNWYQHQVRGKSWDRLADVVNAGGQLWIVWPVCAEALALCGHAGDDWFLDGGQHEWSNRSLRAIAVGQPPMVALYFLLGSSRPDRGDSRWHPFRDIHGASGHTFTGALPFLTAASMTDNLFLKGALYAGSMAMGWSRLHNDRHYLSQIAVGWWMAWLAVRSVDQTQQGQRSWLIVPSMLDEGPGLGLLIRF